MEEMSIFAQDKIYARTWDTYSYLQVLCRNFISIYEASMSVFFSLLFLKKKNNNNNNLIILFLVQIYTQYVLCNIATYQCRH